MKSPDFASCPECHTPDYSGFVVDGADGPVYHCRRCEITYYPTTETKAARPAVSPGTVFAGLVVTGMLALAVLCALIQLIAIPPRPMP